MYKKLTLPNLMNKEKPNCGSIICLKSYTVLIFLSENKLITTFRPYLFVMA